MKKLSVTVCISMSAAALAKLSTLVKHPVRGARCAERTSLHQREVGGPCNASTRAFKSRDYFRAGKRKRLGRLLLCVECKECSRCTSQEPLLCFSLCSFLLIPCSVRLGSLDFRRALNDELVCLFRASRLLRSSRPPAHHMTPTYHNDSARDGFKRYLLGVYRASGTPRRGDVVHRSVGRWAPPTATHHG